MSLKRLTSEHYTVGWYCPLAAPGLQAAQLLFDQKHEQPSFSGGRGPLFPYVYGEMNGHNIVMATAPAGDAGSVIAAQVMSEMRSFHPELKFCLLVSVGGAVPRPDTHDIRLGDLVVGIPDVDARHGGIVQYDFGQAIGHGVFQREGFLSRPNATLLNAVSSMQGKGLPHTKFYEYVDFFKSVHNNLGRDRDFRRPHGDVLFPSNYCHEGNRSCETLGCDRQRGIARKPRPNDRPTVHYGTIASGGIEVKDAVLRDKLTAEDKNILCIEREAAGIVDLLPCLTIFGICDYCDSHDNRKWQPFAAAVAASFAKTILEILRPQQVRR